MAMDSYSQALQARRGKSMDMAMVYGHDGEGDEGAHAVAESMGHGNHGEDTHGTPHAHEETPSPAGVTEHHDQHMPVHNEGEHMAPHPDWHSTEHEDEHTDVEHEIRSHIIGHVSPGEEERMAKAGPRSLGERAKMEAMKKK